SFAMSPAAPGTLYAGTNTGVFVTTNGGTSWTLGAASPTGPYTLVADPFVATTAWAGTIAGGVFETTDAGTSWNSRSTGISNVFRVQAIAIDRQTTTTMYAATAGGGLYKSTNGGGSWAL